MKDATLKKQLFVKSFVITSLHSHRLCRYDQVSQHQVLLFFRQSSLINNPSRVGTACKAAQSAIPVAVTAQYDFCPRWSNSPQGYGDAPGSEEVESRSRERAFRFLPTSWAYRLLPKSSRTWWKHQSCPVMTSQSSRFSLTRFLLVAWSTQWMKISARNGKQHWRLEG